MTIAKYINHPSINAVTEKMEKLGNPTISFDVTSYEETVKEVNKLKKEGFWGNRYSGKNRQGKYRHCLLFPAL